MYLNIEQDEYKRISIINKTKVRLISLFYLKINNL